MSLLLQDLSHSYKGRRDAARRALQNVLVSPPAGRRRRTPDIIAWTPAAAAGSGGGAGEARGASSVVVTQAEADEEQCGWIFLCRDLPAWADVSAPFASGGRRGWVVLAEWLSLVLRSKGGCWCV